MRENANFIALLLHYIQIPFDGRADRLSLGAGGFQ